MKSALILHGTASTSQMNWFPWLKEKLEEKGWNVWVPNLPKAEKPNIKRYSAFLLGNQDWKFNQNSVVIGHSSGAVAILGLLQNMPEGMYVDTCILVGSFKNDLGREDLKELFAGPFDFEKIKTHAKKFIFIHSDNDPYCPLEHAEYLAEKLGGKLLVQKGQGHFNIGSNPKYTQFPFLLKQLQKPG
jgi:hypothetical protein